MAPGKIPRAARLTGARRARDVPIDLELPAAGRADPPGARAQRAPSDSAPARRRGRSARADTRAARCPRRGAAADPGRTPSREQLDRADVVAGVDAEHE